MSNNQLTSIDKAVDNMLETKGVKAMYRRAGMKPPVGKGIHTLKYHRCVTSVGGKAKKAGKKVNPFAVCMASIGKEGAVNPSHQRKESVFNKVVNQLVEMDIEALGDKYDLAIDSTTIKALAACTLEKIMLFKREGNEDAVKTLVGELDSLLMDEQVGADEELAEFVQGILDQAQSEVEEEPEEVEEEPEEVEEEPEEEEEPAEESCGVSRKRKKSKKQEEVTPSISSALAVLGEAMEVSEPSRADVKASIAAIERVYLVTGRPLHSLYMIYQEGSSNKFHYFAIFALKDSEVYTAVNAAGRVGYEPKVHKIATGDLEDVKAAMDAKVGQKTKKGYSAVSV